MRLRKAIILFLFLGVFAGINIRAEELTVSPGKLGDVISGCRFNENTIKLKGRIDARDFSELSRLGEKNINLDMSALKIIGTTLTEADEWGKLQYADGELPAYIFFQSQLVSLKLPENLSIVSEGMISASEVKEIYLPENCVTISDYAFYDCKSLKKINLPVSLKEIGTKAFGGCASLTYLEFPEGIKITGKEVFAGSGLEYLNLGEADFLNDYSLAGNESLQTAEINPEGYIGEGLFMGDSSLEYILGSPKYVPPLFAANSSADHLYQTMISSSYIDDYAFAFGGAQEITLSEDLEYIGEGAFAGCELISIDANPLGRKVVEAHENAFEGINVEDVTLYVTVTGYSLWSKDPFWSRFNIVTGRSSVEGIDSTEGINIAARNGLLLISSGSPIGNYAVYSIDGKALLKGVEKENSLSIDSSQWNEKLIIVKVENETERMSRTLMLK